MPLPVIAIVGRPNVGKSSLFNALIGRRTSITEPTAGVTRDRVGAIFEIDDRYVELIDTGGHGVVDRDDLGQQVEEQIRFAIDQAAIIVFLVDAREGLTPLDRDTADLLRRKADIVLLAANKVDEPHMIAQLGELTRLGYGEPIAVSAMSGLGRRELLERISERLQSIADDPQTEPVMKVALVGKRNAGKSTFVNALAGQPRVIVSEVPGTTRDSIDVRIEKDGRAIVVVDTAGVRKKNKLADDIEFFAYSRTLDSIRQADVVLMLIDSTEPVGQVDKRLAAIVAGEFKPCVLVVNKWDLAKGQASTQDYGDYLEKVLPLVDYAPVSFTSANSSRNVAATIDLATELFKQSRTRIGTGPLNQALQKALAEATPSTKRGKRAPRFYYATQISAQPPTIVVFVNSTQAVAPDHQRFLLNRFRESLPFAEIPIRLIFRARRGSLSANGRPSVRRKSAKRAPAKRRVRG